MCCVLLVQEEAKEGASNETTELRGKKTTNTNNDTDDTNLCDSDLESDDEDNKSEKEGNVDNIGIDKPVDNNVPPEHTCSKNWTASSKAMEPAGSVELITACWRAPAKCYVDVMVGDDDCSTRANCTRDLEAYRLAHPDEPRENYWPFSVDKLGKRVWKKNVGKLALDVPVPSKQLGDPTHQWQVVGGILYAASNNKATTEISKVDARRMKRNYSSSHAQHVLQDFETYRRGNHACLYHHFNDHQFCDPVWCCYSCAPGDKGFKDPSKNKNA